MGSVKRKIKTEDDSILGEASKILKSKKWNNKYDKEREEAQRKFELERLMNPPVGDDFHMSHGHYGSRTEG